jgi:hypothetical protein
MSVLVNKYATGDLNHWLNSESRRYAHSPDYTGKFRAGLCLVRDEPSGLGKESSQYRHYNRGTQETEGDVGVLSKLCRCVWPPPK